MCIRDRQMRAQLDAFDEKEFDRVEAMVRSMTPFERSHPKLINGSRRQRIARGSGMQVSDVNQLLERFTQAQKMMKSLARGGGPVSYTHLRAHETVLDLVCRLLLEKKKKKQLVTIQQQYTC